jgi:hypothetical protein
MDGSRPNTRPSCDGALIMTEKPPKPCGQFGRNVKYQGGVGAACNNTLAPLTQSSQRVNSRGEWLAPPTEGTKIMPTGQTPASDCASCPAPEKSETCVSYRPRENVCARHSPKSKVLEPSASRTPDLSPRMRSSVSKSSLLRVRRINSARIGGISCRISAGMTPTCLVALQPAGGERETTFTSRWRVGFGDPQDPANLLDGVLSLIVEPVCQLYLLAVKSPRSAPCDLGHELPQALLASVHGSGSVRTPPMRQRRGI